jgi:hypothetical protein
LEASQQFSFCRVGLLAPRPTLIPEGQASVFISPRGRVATHFSRLLRHAWVTVGLFLFPGHHTGSFKPLMVPYWNVLSPYESLRSLCFYFNWAPRHEDVLGNGGIAPCIFYLGTRSRWVVNFTLRPFYPQGKSPWYPLDRRLGGPQSRSGRGSGEKNFQPPQGIEP